MALPAVRRRFAYPSADLVTTRLRIDLLLDGVLSPAHRSRVELKRQVDEHRPNIIVLGFPRSGNTFLTAWLQEVVRPAVNVVDGRSTHSALDVHRSASAGFPVIIPARRPIDTCASMMLRGGKFDELDYAQRMLQAYRVWYLTAEKALEHGSVTGITFEQIIKHPAVIADAGPLSSLLDHEVAASMNLDDLATRLRKALANVPGQGSDQDGVEARLMVSLPDPSRVHESQIARALLHDDSLAEDRAGAESAYADFLASAARRGRLAETPAHDGRRTK